MNLAPPQFRRIEQALDAVPRTEVMGRVAEVVGLVIESDGPACRIGDLVLVEPVEGDLPLPCEVVGFKSERLLLMPLGEMEGVRVGSLVRRSEDGLTIPVGDELLGRVLDGLGRPVDGLPEPACALRRGLNGSPPSPLERSLIAEPFATGVRAIDGMLTMGQGQRMGIFAGSGVGKSTLLGMIARHGLAEVNVIALIGERGREVREFISGELGEEGMAKSIVICATSDEPALLRIKAAFAATAVAEHFRALGRSVLLMMDSVTRFAMAQREIGLAIGEPPSTKGYTPSVFALLPRLMERAGCSAEGAMTAIYTVLVDGDDTNEPIADAARSILDGHIVLDRRLTSKGHYPPISIPQSLSRVMPMVAEAQHVQAARGLRELMSAHEEVEDLVAVGAYREGSKPIADRALSRWDEINAFLRQDRADSTPYEQAVGRLQEIVNGSIQA